MVGVRGFEPPASASRTQRSSQTEPHPDLCRCSSNIYAFLIFASRFTLFFSVLMDFQAFYRKKTIHFEKFFTCFCVLLVYFFVPPDALLFARTVE